MSAGALPMSRRIFTRRSTDPAWLSAIALGLVAAAFCVWLVGCQALGLVSPQTDTQRLVYAVGMATSAEQIGDQLLTATPPAISSAKAQEIRAAATLTYSSAMGYLSAAACTPNPTATPAIVCPAVPSLVSALQVVNANLPALEAFVQQYGQPAK